MQQDTPRTWNLLAGFGLALVGVDVLGGSLVASVARNVSFGLKHIFSLLIKLINSALGVLGFWGLTSCMHSTYLITLVCMHTQGFICACPQDFPCVHAHQGFM